MKDFYYKLAKFELRKSAIKNIQYAINLQFFQNMEHKDKYIYSEVKHEGKFCAVVFYDIKKIDKTLYGLANHFYSLIEGE